MDCYILLMIPYWVYIYSGLILRFGLLKLNDKTYCFNLINFKMEFLPYSWLKDKERALKENSFQGTNVKPQLAEIFLISSEQSNALCLLSLILPLWMRLTPLPELSNSSRALFRHCFLATLNIYHYSYLLLLIEMIKKSSWNPWRQKNIIWIYRNHWGTLI